MATSNIVLNVDVRARTGKGGAREARDAGKVPGILYGGKLAPVSISIDMAQIKKALKSGKFIAHTVTLEHKGEKQLVFAQDIQFHPVTDLPAHIDLFRVEADQLIKVHVPVRFTGEGVSPGLKRGGALNIVRHDVELLCPAGAIPEELVADVSTLDIHDTVKISAITLPENVRPTITDRDFTIATITGRGAKDDAEDKLQAAEGEAAAAAAAGSAAAAEAKKGTAAKAPAAAKGAAGKAPAAAKAPAKK